MLASLPAGKSLERISHALRSNISVVLFKFLKIIYNHLCIILLIKHSEANGRNSNKVVLYEDAAKKQLQEFISALHGCELMDQACSSLAAILKNTESRQLHHMLTHGKSGMIFNYVTIHF